MWCKSWYINYIIMKCNVRTCDRVRGSSRGRSSSFSISDLGGRWKYQYDLWQPITLPLTFVPMFKYTIILYSVYVFKENTFTYLDDEKNNIRLGRKLIRLRKICLLWGDGTPTPCHNCPLLEPPWQMENVYIIHIM